ncbi:MAG TPA: helix-hairpin-helix domain-containing protein [Dissulfurispiraceae bacterium]|nr:helix-hairpin-helix domain-containing protein [Dissulfurispiraceae bacterium]
MKRKARVVLSMLVAVFVSLCLVVPGFAVSKEEPKKEAAKPVDLNNTSQKDLEALKGVGPAKAKKIIANRPYKSVDELSKAGLSKKEIDGLKSHVVVGVAPASAPKADAKAQPAAKTPEKAAPTAKEEKPAKDAKKEKDVKKETKAKLAPGQKINLNAASQADLELLPEIGPAKAKAIIDGRPYSKPEDIMKVKGIKQKTYDQIKDNIVVK